MDWNIWGGGLAKFDGSSWTVYNSSNSGLPSNSVYAIAIDGEGNKWIGTWGGGLQSLMDQLDCL
jgi:ligand-binding sensor domain-containing protein